MRIVFAGTPEFSAEILKALIEDNLGVLWYRADESKGIVYDPLETAAVSKVDYREKSPIPLRGWMFGTEKTNALMLARNKLNSVGDVPEYGMRSFSAGHTIKGLLPGATRSPTPSPLPSLQECGTPEPGMSLSGKKTGHRPTAAFPMTKSPLNTLPDSLSTRKTGISTRQSFIR